MYYTGCLLHSATLCTIDAVDGFFGKHIKESHENSISIIF